MGRWKRAQGQLRHLLPQLALGEGAAIAVHEAAQRRGVVALGSAAHGVDQLDLRLEPGDAHLLGCDRDGRALITGSTHCRRRCGRRRQWPFCTNF